VLPDAGIGVESHTEEVCLAATARRTQHKTYLDLLETQAHLSLRFGRISLRRGAGAGVRTEGDGMNKA
jgi:hypothetical protein